MGIPDTYTMPINEHDSQIFTARATAEQTTTTSDSSTQEHLPSCTQIFRTVLFHYKQHKEQPDPPIPLTQDSSSQNFTCEDIKKAIHIKKFTPAEIKKATRNYRKQNILGQGGSGTVFRGTLAGNQQCAIKRPHLENTTRCKDEFVNEIIVLSQINNRSVVKLLGCCFETEVPSIVYEFIPNGALYYHLFDKQNECGLTWNHRLRIAVQVAEVLEYLHTTVRVPIIHRDIKSTNILLDENFMVKVSDFGISKLLGYQNEFNMFVEDALLLDCFSTCVMGTVGYIDPEYLKDGLLSKKSDVYSFGVVLAELLTRRRAIYADSEGEVRHLLAARFLESLKDNRLEEILDEQLVNEGSMEQLEKVAHLARRCLEFKANDRPTMRLVVRELQDISGVYLMDAQQLWRNRNKG